MISKIIASGQSGAERAALHWAIDNGIPIGGWCPHGRLADDGPIDPAFPLTETPTADPLQALEWNVRDSAGTAIFTSGKEITGVSLQTVQFIRTLGRPAIHVADPTYKKVELAKRLAKTVQGHKLQVLHVTGPRGSEDRAVYDFTYEMLARAFGHPDAPRARLDFTVYVKIEETTRDERGLESTNFKTRPTSMRLDVLDPASKQQILNLPRLNWIQIFDAPYSYRLPKGLLRRPEDYYWYVHVNNMELWGLVVGSPDTVMVLERGTGKVIHDGRNFVRV